MIMCAGRSGQVAALAADIAKFGAMAEAAEKAIKLRRVNTAFIPALLS
jgi:hypothetical protein